MSAAERWRRIDFGPKDTPSIDAMIRLSGCTDYRMPVVGECAMDVTVTHALYWPALGPAGSSDARS